MIKNKNYITPLGYKRMVDEHEFLTKVDRPEVTKTVTWAASLGDRSENADYQYGKKRLREIDKRLRFLNRRMNIAEVVNPVDFSSNKIQFGATVSVEDGNGEGRIFCIVGEDEIDIKKGHISWKSPVGSSLLGKEVGDNVIVQVPKGEIEIEILKIEYIKIESI